MGVNILYTTYSIFTFENMKRNVLDGCGPS